MNTPPPAELPVSPNRRPALAPKGRRLPRVSLAGFLTALVLLIVLTPLVQQFQRAQLIEALIMTIVLCTGFAAVRTRRRTHGIALLLVTTALTARWANHVAPERFHPVVFLVPAVAFLLLIVFCLLGFVLRARQVDSEVLCAGISIYLLMGILWGLAYMVVAQVVPTAFVFSTPPGKESTMMGFTAVYFSFITLTTVGYGDITPVSAVARMLAMMEAMTGTLFLGVLIARLVSLYSAAPPPNSNDPQNPNRV